MVTDRFPEALAMKPTRSLRRPALLLLASAVALSACGGVRHEPATMLSSAPGYTARPIDGARPVEMIAITPANVGQYAMPAGAAAGWSYRLGIGDVAQPILDEVAKRCRELVRLTVLQDEALHWLASSQGAPTGLMYQPSLNGRLPLHTTANGKIWLSTLDDASATRIATAGGLGLPARPGQLVGPQALRDTESLLRDLATCRKRGYGLAIEEAEPGVKAIAVVVRAQHDQRVLGTMSIAGPLVRMGPERDAEFHALLLQAAGTLALVWPHDNLPVTGSD